MKKRTLYNEYPAYLKTDMLPFEIPIIYSNDKFYEYIINTSKKYRKTLNDVKIAESKASIPFSFTSYVRENKKREISLINPLSYMMILNFIKDYEKIYLQKFKENKFSIRYAQSKTNDYNYIRKVVRTNIYTEEIDKVEKKNGTYYNIHKYKRSYEFENSNFFQKQMSNYQFFYKLDIKSCFDSIYTHSYKWLVTTDFEESQKLADTKNIYSIMDKIHQKINNHKTNGILIGPEFMRLTSEILLSGIDERIYNKMLIREIHNVKIYRFIDDFYIFAKKHEEIKEVKKIVEEEYKQFQLRFNERKQIEHKDLFVLNEWYAEITYMLNSLDIKKFYSPANKKIILDILVKFKDQRDTVIAYIISLITNTINQEIQMINKINNIGFNELYDNIQLSLEFEQLYRKNFENISIVPKEKLREKYEELKNIMLQKNIINEKRIFRIFEELFFYLKLSPKYINSLKILNLAIESIILENNIDSKISIKYTNTLKNIINRELKLTKDFAENFDDVNNLLLLFEYLKIELEKEDLKELISNENEKNFLRIATIYRYCKNTNEKKYKSLLKDIEKSMSEINIGKDISNQEDIWKILMFPNINEKRIETILKDQNVNLESEGKYIIQFLQDEEGFVDYEKINSIEKLKILNTKIYFKSLVNINY